ncbi:hypothetical protein MJH12_17915, partial [bacterium]|nr:hypothetical protein [bacterium]
PAGSSSDYFRGDRTFVQIPADQLNVTEVTNIKSNTLADGSSPWLNSESNLGASTAGQVLAGDRTWKDLNPSLVGLNQVENLNVLNNFTQNFGQFISTSKIRANTSAGLLLENQSGQGMIITSNGKIGVNTIYPNADFDVLGLGHFNDLIADTFQSESISIESSSVHPLVIHTSAGDSGIVLKVTSSGYVGINTSNPMYYLEVDGTLNINGDLFINGMFFAGGEGQEGGGQFPGEELVEEVAYLTEADRESVLTTTSEFSVPSSSAVADYVNSVVFYKNSIPADQLNSTDVSNLKVGLLSNGSSPWNTKEPAISPSTTSDYYRGDKTFVILDKIAVGLANVPNTDIAYSTPIPADQFGGSEVTALKANTLADGSTPWTGNLSLSSLNASGNIVATGDVQATGDVVANGQLRSQGLLVVNGGADSISEFNAGSTANKSKLVFKAANAVKGSIEYVHSASGPTDRLEILVGGTPKMTIIGNGNVGIGVAGPVEEKLHVIGNSRIEGYLCVDSKTNCDVTGGKSPGFIYSTGTQATGADYAEYFPSNETLVAGDVVGFDSETLKVRKYQNGDKLLGIISTAPGVVGAGDRDPKTHALVGLMGQLPVDRNQVKVIGSDVYTLDHQKIGILLSDGNIYINLNPASETSELKKMILDQQKVIDEMSKKLNFLLQNR